MFTQLKKGRWNFLFFAAATSVFVAAMAAMLSARPVNSDNSTNRASHNNGEQVVTGRYTQHNETTLRFIN